MINYQLLNTYQIHIPLNLQDKFNIFIVAKRIPNKYFKGINLNGNEIIIINIIK